MYGPALIEEPRVLHRDDRLRREILKQCDLLIRKRPHFLAINRDCTEECVVFVQCYPDCAADAAGLRHVSKARGGLVTFIARRVGKVDNPLARQDSSQRGVTIRPDWTTLPEPLAKLWLTVRGAQMKALTIPSSEMAKGSLAEPRCLFQHCVEHRGEVAWRGVDDLQHLGRCGLPLQRLVTLGSTLGKLTLQIGYELLGIG